MHIHPHMHMQINDSARHNDFEERSSRSDMFSIPKAILSQVFSCKCYVIYFEELFPRTPVIGCYVKTE